MSGSQHSSRLPRITLDSMDGQSNYKYYPERNRTTQPQIQVHDAGYNWDASAIQEEKPPQTLRGTMHRFSETTSLQGVPYINRSKKWHTKAIWSLLFFGALAMALYQLYEIFSKYYAAETSSSVKLGYTALAFPSVTFCNLNPMRKSQLYLTPGSFRNFLHELKTDDSLDAKYENVTAPSAPPNRTANPVPTLGRRDIIRLTGNYTDDQYDKYVDDSLHANYGGGERSSRHRIMEQYTERLEAIPQETRHIIGHEKEMIIMSCSFNGRKCSAENFTSFWIREFGNCFTFNSAEMKPKAILSKRSGTQYGLRLVMYLEDFESIDSLSQGRGIRLDVHSFNTSTFPVETGISVAPGFETFIALRMNNISRLSDPFYGGCGDDGVFSREFRKKYTLQACTETCEDLRVAQTCKCRRSAFPYNYSKKRLMQLDICRTPAERECSWKIHHDVNTGNRGCSCPDACNEENYDMILSSARWPTPNLWGALVENVCEGDDAGCYHLQQAGHAGHIAKEDTLRKNFLAVNIYYRDLNFQSVEQKAEYERSQFLSDIGGTIGLWVGASVLTGAEVLDLIIRLFVLCCYKARNGNTSNKAGRGSNQNSRTEPVAITEPAYQQASRPDLNGRNQLHAFSTGSWLNNEQYNRKYP